MSQRRIHPGEAENNNNFKNHEAIAEAIEAALKEQKFFTHDSHWVSQLRSEYKAFFTFPSNHPAPIDPKRPNRTETVADFQRNVALPDKKLRELKRQTELKLEEKKSSSSIDPQSAHYLPFGETLLYSLAADLEKLDVLKFELTKEQIQFLIHQLEHTTTELIKERKQNLNVTEKEFNISLLNKNNDLLRTREEELRLNKTTLNKLQSLKDILILLLDCNEPNYTNMYQTFNDYMNLVMKFRGEKYNVKNWKFLSWLPYAKMQLQTCHNLQSVLANYLKTRIAFSTKDLNVPYVDPRTDYFKTLYFHAESILEAAILKEREKWLSQQPRIEITELAIHIYRSIPELQDNDDKEGINNRQQAAIIRHLLSFLDDYRSHLLTPNEYKKPNFTHPEPWNIQSFRLARLVVSHQLKLNFPPILSHLSSSEPKYEASLSVIHSHMQPPPSPSSNKRRSGSSLTIAPVSVRRASWGAMNEKEAYARGYTLAFGSQLLSMHKIDSEVQEAYKAGYDAANKAIQEAVKKNQQATLPDQAHLNDLASFWIRQRNERRNDDRKKERLKRANSGLLVAEKKPVARRATTGNPLSRSIGQQLQAAVGNLSSQSDAALPGSLNDDVDAITPVSTSASRKYFVGHESSNRESDEVAPLLSSSQNISEDLNTTQRRRNAKHRGHFDPHRLSTVVASTGGSEWDPVKLLKLQHMRSESKGTTLTRSHSNSGDKKNETKLTPSRSDSVKKLMPLETERSDSIHPLPRQPAQLLLTRSDSKASIDKKSSGESTPVKLFHQRRGTVVDTNFSATTLARISVSANALVNSSLGSFKRRQTLQQAGQLISSDIPSAVSSVTSTASLKRQPS